MYRRLRWMLLGAYALICVLYAAMLVWFTLAERDAALRDARSSTALLAHALQEHVVRSLGNADLMLRGVAEWLEAQGGPARFKPDALHMQLARRAVHVPEVRALFVYGADLKMVANSLQPVATPLDGSAREYIAAHRVGADPRLFVGRTIDSPVVPGAYTIPVTIRLAGRDGRLAGVTGAAVDFDYFARFYRSLGLSADASVSLLRTDGAVLFRFPVERFALGDDLRQTDLFAAALKSQNAGTVEMQFPGEQQVRIVSYRRHEALPLVFTVSRDKDAVLAAWREDLVQRAVLFVLVVGLGGGVVALLLRQAKTRLAAEQRFATFFRSTPAAHAITRCDDGKHIEVNEAWTRIMGYTHAEAIGRSALELGLWPDPEERRRWASEVGAHGRFISYATRHRRKDGALIDILLSAEIVDMEDGPHFLISIVDVSAERRARDAMDRLAGFFRSSPSAHAIATLAEGRHIEVNDAWVRTFGHARAEAIGCTGVELGLWLSQEDRDRFAKALAEGGRLVNYAVRFRRRSGEPFDALLSAEVIELDGVRHMLVSTVDITAEQRAQAEIQRLNATLEQRVRDRTAELEASNRELESFSYSVSHDLRAPIRAILGFTEILRGDHAERFDGETRRLLDRIVRAAENMGALMDALLELSRLMRRPIARERIDLSRMAQGVFNELRERTPGRAVDAVVAADLDAFADPVLIRSVLQNLIDNAWKYTARTGAPRIEVGRANGAFFVRDNGAGFEMSYVDRLFRPFERLHRVEEFPGTGVGLATVERIVRRHGGRVWAEGAPDKGATFYFTLPA